MGDPLSDATPGQASPFVVRADTVNLTLDAVRRFRRQQLGGSGGPADAPAVTPANLVWVRNDTGSTLPVFSAVRPAAALIDPTADTATALSARRQPAFSGKAFAAVTDRVLVTIEPAGVNGWVRAVADGVGVGQVVVNALTDGYAQPVVGQTYLESVAAGPARLVLAPAATGAQNAYVQLGLPAGAGGWFARLTTSSGGKWKWVARTLDNTGAWADNGNESAVYNAVPSPRDGSTTDTPTAGLRVWMIPSLQPGYFEFRPDPASTSAFTPGSGTAAGTYTITSSGSWVNTGITLTLPTAGWYLVRCQVAAEAVADGAAYIAVRLRKDADGTAFGSWDGDTMTVTTNAQRYGSVCLFQLTYVTESTTVRLEAQRSTLVTWTTSRIFADSSIGNTGLSYVNFSGP